MAIASFSVTMVLCLTHSHDFYTIDIVQQYLQQQAVPSFRLNTDEFAIHGRFNYSLSPHTNDISLLIDNKEIHASQISAVWYRKLWDLKIPAELDHTYSNIFNQEYITYQQIFFNQLAHLPWMNDMPADHKVCKDKFSQLTTAQAAGLHIPETIFSNDPGVIKNFFERCHGNLIAKLHGSLSKSMEGNTPFFPTTKITQKDLAMLEDLPYCPMIFQQYILKAYELRIIYVDGDFFTGKIPHEKDVTDWRTTRGRAIQWERYELPLSVQQSISTLMQQLGLRFGALDMIRQINGDYVFLEVNPQGEWGMLQRDLAYPIGETIAQKLINRIKDE
ncbi:MAG: MvdC/MvdD family ATP grasp protein [Chitinophagaceae bacterium]